MSPLAYEISRCNPETLTAEDLNQLGYLMYQLTHGKICTVSRQQLERTAQHGIILIARGKRSGLIYGCVTVHFHEPLTGGTIIVEDVVVDERHRGRGIGRALMEAVHALAPHYPGYFDWVELTSSRHRVAAHALYTSLGYEEVPTTLFRHCKLANNDP